MGGSGAPPAHQDVRYEPDERPPLPITAELGLQYAIICIASVVLTPTDHDHHRGRQ